MPCAPFAASNVFLLFRSSNTKSASILMSPNNGLRGVATSILNKMFPSAILLAWLFLNASPTKAQVGNPATTTVAQTSSRCDRVKQRQAIWNLGAQVRIEFDRNQIPTWITGLNLARTSQDPVEAALATLRAIKDVFCASAEDDFGFTGRMEKEDKLGQTHVRIKQTYRGLEVVGQELIVHMTHWSVITINGRFIAGISVPTEGVFDGQRVQQIALDHVASLGGLNSKANDAEPLVVFVDEKDKAYLAYPVIVVYTLKTGEWVKDGPHRDRIFVDAIAGVVVGYNGLIILGTNRGIDGGGEDQMAGLRVNCEGCTRREARKSEI